MWRREEPKLHSQALAALVLVQELCRCPGAGVACIRMHVQLILGRGSAAPCVECVERAVARDSEQPGPKARLAAKAIQAVKPTQERVLSNVCALVGTDNTCRDPEHDALVAGDKHPEASRITGEAPSDELVVGSLVRGSERLRSPGDRVPTHPLVIPTPSLDQTSWPGDAVRRMEVTSGRNFRACSAVPETVGMGPADATKESMMQGMLVVAAISDSVERGFDELFEWLPKLVGFLVVLLLGYVVARVVGRIVTRALRGVGADRTLLGGPGGNWISKVTSSPAALGGKVTFWLIFLGALSIALDVLGIAALEDFVASVWAYLPNVLAALVIFVVAGAIAAGASAFAQRFMGDTPTGRIVATAAPILVMTIATFMILDQLQIAETIVTITYAGLIGAIALGAALAFGLGGRDVAGRMLESAYVEGQGAVAQAKEDTKRGVDRARAEAEQRRDDWQEEEPTTTPTDS